MNTLQHDSIAQCIQYECIVRTFSFGTAALLLCLRLHVRSPARVARQTLLRIQPLQLLLQPRLPAQCLLATAVPVRSRGSQSTIL
jgi:hypothetical protein